MARAFTPFTINKFKGWNSAEKPAGIGDSEFATLTNWNPTEFGTLIKRKALHYPSGVVSGGTNCRIMTIQRTNIGSDYLIWTDGNKLFKTLLPGLNTTTELVLSAASIPSCTWAVEVGGIPNPSQLQITRQPGSTILVDESGTVTAQTGPAGTFCCYFKGRLWVINNLFANGAESRVTYSAAGNLNSWPGANTIDVVPGDGQYLTCLIPYNDQLILFKDRSTFVLSAEGDPSAWTVRTLHPYIGCPGRGAAQIINGFIYFYSGTGVYRTDGTTFEDLSRTIKDQFAGISYDNPTNTNLNDAVFWDNKFILKLYNNSAAAFVYDIYADAWSYWTFAGGAGCNGFARYNEISPDSFYSGNPTNGKIQRMGDDFWTDAANNFVGGTNYTATAYTKLTDFGAPMQIKRNHLTVVSYGGDGNVNDTLGVAYAKDNSTVTATTTKSVNPGSLSSELKFPGAGRSRSLQVRLVQNGPGQCTINGIHLGMETREMVPKGV